MLNKRKVISLLLCCILATFLTGCWDQTNIEDHGFVVGTAIDLADEQSKDSVNIEMTNQIVVPLGLGGPEQGGGGEKAYLNLTSQGESLFNITRNMATQTSRPPFYEHLKVLIVSEDIALEPEMLASMMDLFIRDHEMRRGVNVFITEGKAKDLLQIDPKPEKIPAIFINSITNNEQKALEMINSVRIGELHGRLLEKTSYVLPKVSAEKDKNKIHEEGAAVFHGFNNKMIGTLNREETKGLNLLTEKNKDGSLTFNIDDRLMSFEINDTKSKMKIDTTDLSNLQVSINITAEGGIAEMFGDRSLLKETYMAKIEKQVAEQIEKLAKQTINKVQHELNVDVLDIGDNLRQKHYSVWKKVENNWDRKAGYFSKININVTAEVNVRQTGVTDRAKDREHKND